MGAGAINRPSAKKLSRYPEPPVPSAEETLLTEIRDR